MKHLRSRQSKVAVAILLVVFVILFFWLDLDRFLTLSYIKSIQADVHRQYVIHPARVLILYFLIYIVATALSLPGAAVMTLAGGGFFGFWVGTLVVSFASSIGATLAFLASRFLIRDWVQQRFHDRLSAINQGLEKDGPFYLFTLRLIPVFPFFLINLAMGLTDLRVSVFYLVSQIGMLAGTFVYVNAGTQLAQIDSLKGLVSPGVLGSFVILGIFPLLTKKIIEMVQGHKHLRRFSKPKKFEYDMVVIGAGAAGLVTSYISAAVKAKVALIEKHKMGGDCLNTGCVPSKALIRSARILSDIQRAREFGIRSAAAEFDFAEVMERVQSIIRKIEPHDSVERYTSLGVDCLHGSATIRSPYEVEVNGRILTTRNITIASGASPLLPNIPGLTQMPYYTSDSIWSLRQRPHRLVILGGGPIGCEMAQTFQRLGCQVTQIERRERLMLRGDPDVSMHIESRFVREGIRVLTGHEATRFTFENGANVVYCAGPTQQLRIEFDAILLALGRRANVDNLGLEKLGINTTRSGTVETDECLRTIYPNILVAGDVAGPYQFTHVASHQAWYAAVNGLFRPFRQYKADYRVIPWCIYTDPEVAQVGLTEVDANEKKIPFHLSLYRLDGLDRAVCESENEGFIKVLTVPGTDKILGVTIVGPHAGEIIAEYVLAMKYNLGLNKILGTIHTYPTMAEANKYVAGVWKRETAPKAALVLLERFHRWRRG